MELGNILFLDIFILIVIFVFFIFFKLKYIKSIQISFYTKISTILLTVLTSIDIIFCTNSFLLNNFTICMAFILLYIILHAFIPYIFFILLLESTKKTSILNNAKLMLIYALPVIIFSILTIITPLCGLMMTITNQNASTDITFYSSYYVIFYSEYIIYWLAIVYITFKKRNYIPSENIVIFQGYALSTAVFFFLNIINDSAIPYIYLFAFFLFLYYIASFNHQLYKGFSSSNERNKNHFINALNTSLTDKKNFIIVAVIIDDFKELKRKYGDKNTSILLTNLQNFFVKLFPDNEIYHFDELHFVLMLDNDKNFRSSGPIIDDITSIFNMPWNIGNSREKMSVTISCLFCPEDSDSVTEIIDVLRNSVFESQKNGTGGIIYGKEYIYNREHKMNLLTEEIKRLEALAKQTIDSKVYQETSKKERDIFLANISHDIRTPLNSVIGLSEMLLKETSLSVSVRHKIEDIHVASNSLFSLINNMFDYFEIEAGNINILENEYDINEISQEAVNIVYSQAKEKHLDISFNIDNNIPCKLIGDASKLRQLFINLLRNSIRQTDNGSVEFDIKYKSTAYDSVNLIVTIKDTSIGFSKDEIEHFFDNISVFDTRREHFSENSTLTLDVCRKIIHLMGGDISAESPNENGCIISFRIPQKIADFTTVGEAEATTIYKTKAFTETFTAPNANILVVDDNRLNREITKGLLKPYQVNVTTAKSGEECIELVKQNIYDLIFMDHLMPEMDGIDTKNNIRNMSGAYFKTVPIIILTANVGADNRNYFINEGFIDYIPKPIDIALLDSSLKKALAPEFIKEIGSTEEASDSLFKNDLLIKIPNIDEKIALSNYKTEEDLKNALLRFTQNTPQMLSELETALTCNNISLYMMYITNLTNTAQKLGLMRLVKFGNAHEKAASENNIEYLQKNLPFFIQAYKKTLDSIILE